MSMKSNTKEESERKAEEAKAAEQANWPLLRPEWPELKPEEGQGSFEKKSKK